jgi:creatinine amidohydrolase/Fe(II)-dependent formamide hydrolase-like protein
MGDPTVATVEKGQAIADAAVRRLVAVIDEYRAATPQDGPVVASTGV